MALVYASQGCTDERMNNEEVSPPGSGGNRTPTRERRVYAASLWWHTVVMGPAALMAHKSGWTDWSDAAPVRPSHAENESERFYEGASVEALTLPCCQRADKSRRTRTALHFSRSGAHKTLY